MTENTRISTISKNYAQALVQVAQEANTFEEIKEQLLQVKEVLDSSKDLAVVMENTSISTGKKIEILDSIFANKISLKVLNFLKLLVDKNRFNEFDSILTAYTEILDNKSNKKKVEIISPIKLTFENKTNVLFTLEKKLNCEVIPTWSVDADIIAGLVFKFDDYVIDTSVRNKIENLRKNIIR